MLHYYNYCIKQAIPDSEWKIISMKSMMLTLTIKIPVVVQKLNLDIPAIEAADIIIR